MGIGKIASCAEYRMDKQFQKWMIFGISIVFGIEKIWKFVYFSSCKFWKFVNFTI